MRNQNLQRRVTRLTAPTAPHDLRARCLATIPTSARDNAHLKTPSVATRKGQIQRLSFGGAFLFLALVGSAFWSTLPVNDSGTTSGSAAFAQTVRAMQNISNAHCIGKKLAYGKGWRTSNWTNWEGWFNKQRGGYFVQWSEQRLSNESTSPSHKRFDVVRTLLLPNGQVYERSGDELTTRSDMSQWNHTQMGAADLALGSASGQSPELRAYNVGDAPKLTSQQKVRWRGQAANLFLFLQTPYDKRTPAIRTKIYVNPTTNLVIGKQDFAVFKDGTSHLASEMSIDYVSPDASLFNPASLKQGAKLIQQQSARR